MKEELVELIKLFAEASVREADITGGNKVKFGSTRHLKDLDRRLEDMKMWRDRSRKGSEQRANYTRVISRLRAERASAQRASEKSNITEAEMHFRVGEEFEADENNARETYNATLQRLEDYDKNVKIELDLDAKIRELDLKKAKRSKNLERRAAAEREIAKLAKLPEYTYDPVIVRMTRSTLEKACDKAREEYADFNPRLVRARKPKEEKKHQLPDENTKSFIDINKVISLRWYEWPTNINSSKKEYFIPGGMYGPGEEWLAWIFGAKPQGTGYPFDLVTKNGSRWEVKQLKAPSETIRTHVHGIVAYQKLKPRLTTIIKQLERFNNIIVDKVNVNEVFTDPADVETLSRVQEFFDDDIHGFLSDELSIDRFKKLYAILRIVADLKRRHTTQKDVRTQVTLNDKTFDVDKSTFIDVINRVEKDESEQKALLNDWDEFQIALASLQDSAFENPKVFFNEWFAALDPVEVFKGVDGVFIVNANGYCLISKKDIPHALKFIAVSMGAPRFKFVHF